MFSRGVGAQAEEEGHHQALLTELAKVTSHDGRAKIGDCTGTTCIMAARTDEIFVEDECSHALPLAEGLGGCYVEETVSRRAASDGWAPPRRAAARILGWQPPPPRCGVA